MANTLTAHHATVVAQEALEVLRKNTVMPKLVTNYFEADTATRGKTVRVPKIGALTANDKTAGSGVTVQDATSTNVDITLDQHKETTFIIEDVDQAVTSGNLSAMYLESGLTAITEAVDGSLTGLYTGLSQSQGAQGTAVDAAAIRTARQTLSTNKAPLADRYIVAGPEMYAQLLGIDAFTSVEKYGSSTPIMEGELGKIYGFKVFESQSIVTATADQNLVFNKRAFGLAVRPLPQEEAPGVMQRVVSDPVSGLSVRVTMSYDADKLGVKTTVDVLYGVAELDDNMAIKLLT